jgi:hypothetical protein
VSKLAFFFLTLVGAVPAGGTLYLLINNLFDRANKLGGVLLGVSIAAAVCMVLVTLTPFIVLVFYKDTRMLTGGGGGAAGIAAGGVAAAAGAGAAVAAASDGDGFGDAIPDDFDEEELAASGGADAFDDEYDDAEYDDSEYEDFDMDEYEDE